MGFIRRFRGSIAIAFALAVACESAPPQAPYPHESILAVIAELKIFLRQDPYRRPPGQDVEGRNIFRVSLERLNQLQDISDPEYRDILAFARGECLERLGDWSAARQAFESAAAAGTDLAASARARAAAADRMAGLVGRPASASTLEGYLNDRTVLVGRLKAWIAENPPYPDGACVRRECERAQAEIVRLLLENRMVLEDAPKRAAQAVDELLADHPDSARVSEHWLLKGELYETLARDWAVQNPPDSLRFGDGATWQAWVEQARVAYQRVARADGDPAKPEGQARLRALDAFASRIQTLAR